MSGRLPAIDAARGMAILAVVLLHGLYSGPRAEMPGLVWHIVYTLGAVRMPMLLLISGFLSAGLVGDPRRAASRVATLIWLYLLWSLLSYPVEYHTGMRAPPGLGHALVAPASHVWFLAAVALLTAGVGVLPRSGVAVLGLALLGWNVLAAPANLGWYSLTTYGPFFCLGLLAPTLVHRSLNASWPMVLVLLASFLAVRAVAHGTAEEVVSGLLGCAAFLPIAGMAARTPVAGAWLVWLGQHTLPVYLAHMPLLILARLVAPAGLAWLALAAVLAVALPLILYRARARLRLHAAFAAPYPLAAAITRTRSASPDFKH